MATIKHKTLAEAIREDNFSYLDSMADSHDLQMIDKQSILLLLKMNDTNKLLAEREKEKANLEIRYKQKYRRAYAKYADASITESHKKLLAELECEDIEKELAVAEIYVKEHNRQLNQIRTELDILKTLGYHIQQELRSV